MADEILRQQNQPIGLNQSDLDSLPENHPLRQTSSKEDSIKKAPLKPSDVMNIPGISGHMPPAVAKALKRVQEENEENASFGNSTQSRVNVNPVKPNFVVPRNASLELTNLLESLKNQSSLYEEITLPSLGKFYNGEDGPTNGKLHIRPMTGEEEQILATPRFIKKGQALDMIFQRCIEEKTQTQSLLSIDRTFLLIYLRGISYGPAYDVEIKCPECSSKFATSIDLNSIPVDNPPENLSSSADLCGKLPKSNFSFTYRMSLGKDEFEIQDHRERRVKKYGDQAADDTLTYRISQLVESIENVKDKDEILYIIKNLSMQDISYLRGIVTDPGWGLDTKIPMGCPSCLAEFDIDLPLDTSFFFPRRKKEQTQA